MLHIAADNHGIGAKGPGHPHGHGRVHPEGACLITASGHHAPVRHAADNYRKTVQPAVAQPFHGYEKGIEVHMHNGSVVAGDCHKKNIIFVESLIFSCTFD